MSTNCKLKRQSEMGSPQLRRATTESHRPAIQEVQAICRCCAIVVLISTCVLTSQIIPFKAYLIHSVSFFHQIMSSLNFHSHGFIISTVTHRQCFNVWPSRRWRRQSTTIVRSKHHAGTLLLIAHLLQQSTWDTPAWSSFSASWCTDRTISGKQLVVI